MTKLDDVKSKVRRHNELLKDLIRVNIEREKLIALIPGIPEPDEKQIAKDTQDKFFEDVINDLDEIYNDSMGKIYG